MPPPPHLDDGLVAHHHHHHHHHDHVSYGDAHLTCSPSKDLAIHVYSNLAKLHKQDMIPYLPRIMSSVMASLSCSPRLHSACSDVVVSLALHIIDLSQDPSSNEETLRSLCLPLIPSLSCENLNLSSGSATCLKALVESDPWRFFAPLDLQELVCSRAISAFSAHAHAHAAAAADNDDYNRDRHWDRSHSVSLISLLRSLAEFSSNVVIQGYGTRLLSVGMEILQFSSSSSRRTRRIAAELLESILKVVDSDLLDLDLSPIFGVLEGHRRDGFTSSRRSFCPSIAKPLVLHPSQKHNFPQISLDSSFRTMQHDTKNLSLQKFTAEKPIYDKENFPPPSGNKTGGHSHGFSTMHSTNKNGSLKRNILNSPAQVPLLSLSPITGNGLDFTIDGSLDEEDEFFLSTAGRFFIQSNDDENDDPKDGQLFTLSKDSLASINDEKPYHPEDDCESIISFENGSPLVNKQKSKEDLLSTLKDHLQQDENSLCSDWEQEGSLDFDFDPSGDSDFNPLGETLQETPVSNGYDYLMMETVSQVSNLSPVNNGTLDLDCQTMYDMMVSIKSQASNLSPGSSFARGYSDEDNCSRVKSPRYFDGNTNGELEMHDLLIRSSDCSDEEGSSTFKPTPSKVIRSSCYSKNSNPAHDTAAGSVISMNREILDLHSKPMRIVNKSRRTIVFHLLKQSTKLFLELAFSIFVIYVAVIVCLADDHQALVPT